MSRNFFQDILNLDSLVYWVRNTFLGGTFQRQGDPNKGANAIDPMKSRQLLQPGAPPRPGMPGARPGQPPAPPARPDQPPQAQGTPPRPGQPAPPARPGQAPPRPGQPPQAQTPPLRPGQAPVLPGTPGLPPQVSGALPGMPARPGMPNLPANPVTERGNQEAMLVRVRIQNWFQENVTRGFDRLYTGIRSFFERRA